MDWSIPGLPVHNQLLKLAQTHVHWIGDAIQPSHPQSSPSPPAFKLSQQQCPFQMSHFFLTRWEVGHNIGASSLASVLPMNIQGLFPLGLTDLTSLLSKGLSRVFSSTTVRRHQLSGTQPFLLSSYHIHTWLLEKTIALTIHTFVGKVMSLLFNTLCWS